MFLIHSRPVRNGHFKHRPKIFQNLLMGHFWQDDLSCWFSLARILFILEDEAIPTGPL